MAHLFFSYAHDDAERMYPVHARMELVTEHNLWLDKIGLERGTAWENSIKAAIDDSYGVIFAVTKIFITRPFILNKEIPWAFERFKDKQGVQLFPILFDDVELPDLLKTPFITHLIDARDGDMERVNAELKRVLPDAQAGTQPFVVSWPRLTNFKGRDQQLIDLHQKLVGAGRVGVKTAGLHGTGGIGKTQLAVEYVHRYRYYYPGGVYWLNAGADWRKEIGDCAVHIDRSLIGRSAEEMALAFKALLAAQASDALLVLDNVANPADVTRLEIAPKLTLMDLCQQTRARLLLTTRVQNLPAGFESVSVQVLQPLDARAVLLDAWTNQLRADSPDIAKLDTIAKALGYLPLALGWMAAALRELPDLSPSELLVELRARGLDDLIGELQANQISLGTPEYHDRLVGTALGWQLSRLSSETPKHLLALTAAYGEAAVVPLERLRLLAGLPDKGLVKPFPKAVKELQAYNLVESLEDGTAFRLHPLTQQYALQNLNAEGLLQAHTPYLVTAYRDPKILDGQMRERGFAAVLGDLTATQTILSSTDPALNKLVRLLTLEEPTLIRLPEGAQASYIVQQIRERAHHEGDDDLRAACDAWLDGKPHLRHSGLRYPASSALLRTMSGHTGGVYGAIQLTDGRILSWSADSSLRLWQSNGSPGLVLQGHTGSVNGAIQLTDGRILSWSGGFASNDHTLRLWQPDGSPGPVLQVHARRVNGAIQLADGRILSWSADTTLRLWQPDGSPGPVLQGHARRVNGAIQLADGRILSWSADRTLRLWHPDGSPGPVLQGHTAEGAIQLADGRILSWSADRHLRLWQSDGTPGPVLQGHTGRVSGAIQLTDGRILSWSGDTTLRLWHPDGSPGTVLQGHTAEGAIQLADGRILSWSANHTLRLWQPDVTPGPVLQGHTGRVSGAIQLADGRILSWSADTTLRLWHPDISSGPVLQGHTGRVSDAIQLADDRILSWSYDNTLRLWHLDGSPGPVLQGHARRVNGAIQLADDRILSWSGDSSLRLWQSDGSPGPVLQGHAGRVNGAIQLADGHILSWSADHTLHLWQSDGTPGPVLQSHTGRVNGAIQLADGRILSWSGDSSLRLWQPDGTPGLDLQGHTSFVSSAIQLADGRILSWSDDTTLRLWHPDGSSGPVLQGHSDRVNGAIQLADGHILSWSADTTLRLWHPDGSSGPVLKSHTSFVSGAIQLADGRIVSWPDDHILCLWQPDGTPGPVLQGHTGRVNGAIQLTEGHILSWSDDGTLRLWHPNGIACAIYTGQAWITGCLRVGDKIVAGDRHGRMLFLKMASL